MERGDVTVTGHELRVVPYSADFGDEASTASVSRLIPSPPQPRWRGDGSASPGRPT
jgi:hypothetical protein